MLQPESISTLLPGLSVAKIQDGSRVTMVLRTEANSDCVLHWGLSRRPGAPWRRPPAKCWPAGTTPVDAHAVRTPFVLNEKGQREVRVQLELPYPAANLASVLYFPKENRWLKNNGKDFFIELPHAPGALLSPEEALAKGTPADARRRTLVLDGGTRLATALTVTPASIRVSLVCDAELPVLLHWGLTQRFRHEWHLPPEQLRPAGTILVEQAVRTPFTLRDGLQWLELEFPRPIEGPGPRGLRFVLFQPDDGAWLKSNGKDVYLPLFEDSDDPRLPAALRELAEPIVAAEMAASSWTLMHRYNLCHDLLGAAQGAEALALLFAWLRYSATRHLDWQRCYNTKPRELAQAQDRLTRRLAALWKQTPPEAGAPEAQGRLWPRLMLTTLGRGGDGQRIRDEILHIMHRNNLKEASGTFVEEWHQKLHNNTTPDDVVICEAYLAFLRSNGDRAEFYRTLEQKGVTRERLQSFERPIKTEPVFFADRREALLREFENFLQILKSVHAGTDLGSAAGAARGRLDGEMNRKLDAVFAARQRGQGDELLAIVSAREGLVQALARTTDEGALRDLLFLDLALEEALRMGIERQNLSRLDRDRLTDLIDLALRNLAASVDSEELRLVVRHWMVLRNLPRDGREWALHAKSVADRASRWIAGFTDEMYRLLQPRAEFLGEAFQVPAWTVALFSEEVVRGGPAFPLALLLRHLDPILRKAAGLGGWQVISPARAWGRVRLTDSLLAVQEDRFAEPTVLIADRVAGNEEIPAGVTAVITLDAPDLVSHSAVRARNARVLFATCFERPAYERLKGLRDRTLSLCVTPAGEVNYHEAAAADTEDSSEASSTGTITRRTRHDSVAWVLTQDQFTPEVVGGKSNNLNGLRGRLPDWIHLPISLALPFGVCERTLQDADNAAVRRRCEEWIAATATNPSDALARLRSALVELSPPAGLKEALLAAWQLAGLAPVPWEQAWSTIRKVWASKWNDRAFLSRRARGIPHADLFMAVLIQQVVEADYAFVIHTTNPLTGNPAELYAEVVLGLGETLVGNYPGRSLGFVCRKADLGLELLSYPGKSLGLYGKGVIFRSDSNGEDLEGFAGAGLYDSFLAEEPQRRTLSYIGERLVWDRRFRDDLLRSIARVGLEVEKVLGSAQDIEGAVAGGQMYVVQTRPQVGLAGA